jgi:hypothetical protein
MMHVKAPQPYDPNDNMIIFLGGSIEMGAAEKWQDRFVDAMKDHDVTLLNPRRDDWDSSWKQDKNDLQFSKQVNWELDAQANADLIIYYFDPNTKSPITLLELGLFADKDVIVCCPPSFWRSGNVEIVCQRCGIPVVYTFETLIDEVNAFFSATIY